LLSNPATVLAVSKAITKAMEDNAREAIATGKHPIDTIVHIKGTITVGEQFEQRIVAKAEPWTLLAIALSKLNGHTIESIVQEALNKEIDIEVIKERAAKAIQAIKAPTVTQCNGKVTSKLVINEIEQVNTDAIIQVQINAA
jgi:Glu-tRNA(Gln) amidotransferase subunit E-like FAD-binding protein